jgi:Parvulin-like peptidyl-prolyl isomerase
VSEDIGSAKLGGDLGIITEGMMDAEFEKALATLKEGEVSEVIQTVYGFQIIKLVSKEADTIEPFEQVKEKVTELFKRDIAGEKFDQLAERFAALSFENPDSLEPLADELGLKIQQQSGITQLNGEGIASNDKVRHAVFKEDVLAGNNSEVLELNSEHFVVLRVNLHTPEEVLPLEAVKSSVELSVKKREVSAAIKR